MTARPQIIFDNGKPAFAVIPYDQYVALTVNKAKQPKSSDDEFVPFVLDDYIKNPIRIARVEAGIKQQELAKRLKVTQGYISKIEGRNFDVSLKLLERVKLVLQTKRKAA